jgi:hypothetical protein
MMKMETDKADRARDQGLAATGGVSEKIGKQLDSRGVMRSSYQWGARLDNKLPQGRKTSHTGYRWQSGKYAGMVRMEGRSGTREKRTTYRTFRVVSRNSDARSWIVPAAEPIPIRQAVIDFIAQNANINDIITRAIQRDIS